MQDMYVLQSQFNSAITNQIFVLFFWRSFHVDVTLYISERGNTPCEIMGRKGRVFLTQFAMIIHNYKARAALVYYQCLCTTFEETILTKKETQMVFSSQPEQKAAAGLVNN